VWQQRPRGAPPGCTSEPTLDPLASCSPRSRKHLRSRDEHELSSLHGLTGGAPVDGKSRFSEPTRAGIGLAPSEITAEFKKLPLKGMIKG
jgi:hypothetical protein